MQVTRLVPHAQLPTPSTVGYDLYSAESYVVQPGDRCVISTGISVNIPDGFYGMLAAKTGILIKHGVEVGSGIIEPGYDGELKVVLINHDRRAFVVRPGYRVAQLVLQAFSRIEIFQDNLHSES